jgi:hypothetical protein
VDARGLQAGEQRDFWPYLGGRSRGLEWLETACGQAPLGRVAVETGSLIVTGNGMDGRSRVSRAGKLRRYTASDQQGD